MTEQPKGSGFSTLAIHAGVNHEAAARPSIDPFSSWVFDGNRPPAPYDPTVIGATVTAILEERVAALEGGSAAVAVASGRAARIVALHTLLRPGDELVVVRSRFGDLPDRFELVFEGFGWQIRWADADRSESLVEALSDRTRAIFVESIGRPGGQVADIEAVARVARRARIPLVVDNSLATPYLLRPLEHGADIVVHSATYLGGPGHATGGLVVDGGTFDWVRDDRYPLLSQPASRHGGVVIGETFGNFAFATACRLLGRSELDLALSPFNAFLILNGIETLPLRMQRHCDSALAVAHHLERHPAVKWVRYAGLARDPGHALALRYCPRGAGAAFTFGLAGGHDAADLLMHNLKLFSRRPEEGSTRSRIDHLASAHRQWADRSTMCVAVGLEDIDDIVADLDQALAR